MYRLAYVNTMLLAIIMLAVCGCSSGGAALTPDTQEGDQNPGLVTTAQGHHILGIFSFEFDSATQKLTAVPNREVMAHYNVTPYLLPPYCDDCLKFEVLYYFPDLHEIWIEITVKNPYPFTGYDIRPILIHNQPGWDIRGNDGYTSLFDDGGDIEINPYVHMVDEIEPDQYVDIYRGIEYPPNPDFAGAKVVIDASWPGHCEDVYRLRENDNNIIVDINGSMVHAEVEAYDWQDDILSITMDASPIAADTVEFTKDPVSNILWTADFFAPGASGDVPPGEYKLLVTATSDTPIQTYTYIPVFLNPASMPVNVTPRNLAFGTSSIIAWDNHRLVSRGSRFSLDVFDTSLQGLPIWTSLVRMPAQPGGATSDLVLLGNIACVGIRKGYVHFIDISDIYIPEVIGGIPFDEGNEHWVGALEGGEGYLYVTCASGDIPFYDYRIMIIDMNASPSPQVVGGLKTARQAVDLAVQGDYLYYTQGKEVIYIVDIADHANPVLVDEIPLPTEPYLYYCGKLLISGNYLFGLLNSYDDALAAWDISTPGQPVLTGFTELPGKLMWDMEIFDDKVLVTCEDTCAHVVDISPTGGLSYAGAVTTEGNTQHIASSPDRVYITEDSPDGISAYTVTPSGMPEKIGKLPKLSDPGCINLDGEYAYVIDDSDRDTFRVLDIDPPERLNVLSSIVVGSRYRHVRCMDVDGSTACILVDNNNADSIFLTVVSIENPEEPEIVADVQVNLDWSPEEIYVANGYAYASAKQGIVIFDISPPEAAHVFDVFETPDTVNILGYHNGRLFCHSYVYGFMMYDVSNPETPHFLGSMPYDKHIIGFAAKQNYAYASVYGEIIVIDISDPDAMMVVDNAEIEFNHKTELSVMGGFLFVPAYQGGIWIASTLPPGTIEPVFFLEFPGGYGAADEVACQNGYLYACVDGFSNQLLIYKWW